MPGDTWTCTYDKLEDCYIPGDTLPPVKYEWRTRYYSYFWKVGIELRKNDKVKRYTPMRSDKRPIIKGNVVGIFVDNNDDDPKWMFFEFSECVITKFRVKTNYILLSDDDDGVKVEFQDEEPIKIPDNDEW